MKIELDNDLYVVYLYNCDKDIKSIVKDVIYKLNKYYDVSYDGYEIKAYINKYFGVILEIKEGYSMHNGINIDLKVLKDTLFLYEVSDPLDYLDNDIYYYDNKFYISIKKPNIGLIENSNIIYKEDVYKIIGKGIKI